MNRAPIALLLVLAAACGSQRDAEAVPGSQGDTTAFRVPGACVPGSPRVRITRSDSASANPEGKLSSREVWYRIVSGRDTAYAYPVRTDGVRDSVGRPLRVLALAGTEHFSGTMIGVFAQCEGAEHAQIWEPNYGDDPELGDPRRGADGRVWRDLLWVTRAASSDPNSDATYAHVLRFSEGKYNLEPTSERIRPTGANYCPVDGRFVHILGTYREPPDTSGSVEVRVVPYDTARRTRAAEFPKPITGEQTWRGYLNPDEVEDRIVAFVKPDGAREVAVYAGCGGHAHVQVLARTAATGARPLATRSGDWRDLALLGADGEYRIRWSGSAGYASGVALPPVRRE